LIFRIFQCLFADFQESNWTSSLRKFTFPELPAISDQNSLSDFTYEDENGTMAAFLNIPGDGGRVFHIEVKTSKEVEDGFSFSPRQFKTVIDMLAWLIYIDAKCILWK